MPLLTFATSVVPQRFGRLGINPCRICNKNLHICRLHRTHPRRARMGRDARKTAKQTPASTSAAASWPSDVVFLDSLRYDAASVSPDVIEKYAPSARTRDQAPRAMTGNAREGASSMMRRIRRAESSACSRTRGCEVGNASSTTTASSRRARTVPRRRIIQLAFGDANELAIDAEKEGNEARFCNDFQKHGSIAKCEI